MNRLILASLLTLPMVAGAYSTGTTLGGTTTTVNAGPGAQTDPKVDGNLVAYTDSTTAGIHFFDFLTNIDSSIPGPATGYDFLSDVSGTNVVFTRVEGAKSSIWAFNTATNGPATELAPLATSNRRGAAIGGATVAWQDASFSTAATVVSEIVAYDLVGGTAVRITEDLLIDKSPSVAPSGNVIVWEKCATSSSPCDIFKATKVGALWTAAQVTNTPEGESFPDTNGTLVVYASARSGSATGSDVYWTPVAGGPESQLALAGEQRNPNISGNVIAFEGMNLADAVPNWDIFLYDLSTTTLYQLTNTPGLDETLNDISVTGTQARVVWSVAELGDYNVYGYTFDLAAGTADAGTGHDDDCDDDDGEDEHHDGHHDGHHGGDGHGNDEGRHQGGHAKVGGEHGGHAAASHHAASQGHVASVSASGVHSFTAPDSAVGCSSSGGGAMIAGLLALAGVLLLGRTRAAVPVRRNNRR